ncbi:uncharacterized protein RhoGAP71E isoform X2 [Bemisia tabaci]|uniref:uncharacterized protein RhoGAP71E isoform X2 n=1 Tax=Bemisia tabaci TaxID=7038 RepID=UPI001946C064
MQRRAATLSNVVTACTHPSTVLYPYQLEKVKFGVSLDEVCKNDIPGPLLVLILKLNKEAPAKKDVFRAPGHQGSMKQLIHFLQTGRLMNMENYSVYTIASVLKKFLRKLPNGIFGRAGEQKLFSVVTEVTDPQEQNELINKLITSLPPYTQRLLVLLFGTFRVIAINSERAQTGMTSEALGVSVAPSFFQTCVSDGKTAKMEDVLRFKTATQITKFLIDNFGARNLFGRANYEFYARITGRILKVEDEWIYSWYPSSVLPRQLSLESDSNTWLQYQLENYRNLESMAHQEESHSTPAFIGSPECQLNFPLHCNPPGGHENILLENCARLSLSLGENGLLKVHERQTARMRTRSEWFLNPCEQMFHFDVDSDPASLNILKGANYVCPATNAGLSASAESVSKRPSIRRTSSRTHYSRGTLYDKENGTDTKKAVSRQPSNAADSQDCTSSESLDSTGQKLLVNLSYKPRI